MLTTDTFMSFYVHDSLCVSDKPIDCIHLRRLYLKGVYFTATQKGGEKKADKEAVKSEKLWVKVQKKCSDLSTYIFSKEPISVNAKMTVFLFAFFAELFCSAQS